VLEQSNTLERKSQKKRNQRNQRKTLKRTQRKTPRWKKRKRKSWSRMRTSTTNTLQITSNSLPLRAQTVVLDHLLLQMP
ncbi:hypothetical protein PIB30_064905, partial [Stylosanthes scabra]|nr:hypothetical protein [Stylosanthes scabra]